MLPIESGKKIDPEEHSVLSCDFYGVQYFFYGELENQEFLRDEFVMFKFSLADQVFRFEKRRSTRFSINKMLRSLIIFYIFLSFFLINIFSITLN